MVTLGRWYRYCYPKVNMLSHIAWDISIKKDASRVFTRLQEARFEIDKKTLHKLHHLGIVRIGLLPKLLYRRLKQSGDFLACRGRLRTLRKRSRHGPQCCHSPLPGCFA